VDELASGVAPASAPDLSSAIGLAPGATAGIVVTAFYGLALIETPLLAWSERVSARWFSAASLLALGLATVGAAFAHGPIALAICLALYGPAAGCALAVAEGVLVESSENRERTLARLTIAAALGDLAVPALLFILDRVGVGWRTAFVVAGAVAIVLALVHASARSLDSAVESEDDDEASIVEALRVAFRTPALLGWSLACVLVNLTDEVLVAFAAVHLASLGADVRATALAAWTIGGLVGLAAIERWIDRVRPMRLLVVTCVVSAIGLTSLALTHHSLIACASLALVGVATSTFHPLVKARAYASLPGRPALVNATLSALVPLDALAPLVLGAIATTYGSSAALLALLVAPIGVGLAAYRAR
jgi:MFS family permease